MPPRRKSIPGSSVPTDVPVPRRRGRPRRQPEVPPSIDPETTAIPDEPVPPVPPTDEAHHQDASVEIPAPQY